MGGGGGWSQSVPFHKNGKQGTAHSIHCIPSEMPVTPCGVTHTPSLAVMSNKESTFQGNQFGVHFRSCQAKWNTAPWWTKTVARGDREWTPPSSPSPSPHPTPACSQGHQKPAVYYPPVLRSCHKHLSAFKGQNARIH